MAEEPSPNATQLAGDDDITAELHDFYPDALHNEVRTDLHPEQVADLRCRRMLAMVMIGTVCAVSILLAVFHPDQVPWPVLVITPFLALGGLLTRFNR
jgi:hypothetical protein